MLPHKPRLHAKPAGDSLPRLLSHPNVLFPGITDVPFFALPKSYRRVTAVTFTPSGRSRRLALVGGSGGGLPRRYAPVFRCAALLLFAAFRIPARQARFLPPATSTSRLHPIE